MKILLLILTMMVATFVHAETVNAPATIKVLAYDTNGDREITKQSLLNGDDKFLVRRATTEEINQRTPGLIKSSDGQNYRPVTVEELVKIDTDFNHAITSKELEGLSIRMAIYDPTDQAYTVAPLESDGISYLRIETKDSAPIIKLVPIRGSTPIKVETVEMTKL